jgi:O-antigen/teichoic acid export membrane protein
LAIAPSSAHLDVALGSLALSALVPVAYLFGERALSFGVASRRTVPVQALAIAQLGLWLAASADRAVFAHFDPRSAALYAAIYGLLDRIYRTLANASLWGALPKLFAGGGGAAERSSGTVRAVCVIASTAGLVAITPRLVGSLTGGRYRPGYTLTTMLATALGLMLIATPLYARALATRRIWPLAFVAAGVGLANLIGNLFVIPRAGTIGAALVTLVTYTVWLASLSLFVRHSRLLPIDESVSAKRRLDAFRPQGASR